MLWFLKSIYIYIGYLIKVWVTLQHVFILILIPYYSTHHFSGFYWIYIIFIDALDNLNNKQAIKLADGILKKQKDCACAKVSYSYFVFENLL